ncbi:MAG: DMT family transporter [Paracoccaceae bacterium]
MANPAVPALRGLPFGPEAGMTLMVVAVLLIPINDTLSKLLTQYFQPVEIAFWRTAFQSGALLIAARLFRLRLRDGLFSPVLALGGVLIATALICLISAFTVMPIATAISIFFVEPLILTVLSALLLGEKTGWRRYLAVAVGLLGAVIVIRPSWASFGVYSVLPLGAALAFACNMILLRRVARSRSGLAIQCGMSFYGCLAVGTGLVAASALDLFNWSAPAAPAHVWPLFAAMGLLSSVTFLLIAEAFRRVEASTLAPFQYLEIIGATLLGYLVFGEFPDSLTWLGTAVILSSGGYVFYRERQIKRRARAS